MGKRYSTMAMVIRNSSRSLCVARVLLMKSLLYSLATELLIIREAMIWCMNFRCNKGEIHTDFLTTKELVI